MVRPREFDEAEVLDAAIHRFWMDGYAATSVKDLVADTGLTAASLYNAFDDKRGIFRAALARFIETSIESRIARAEALAPREAIFCFFQDILDRSLSDAEHKGCLVVNSPLEVAPHDQEFGAVIEAALQAIEAFFLERLRQGQASGTISRALPAEKLARHLLSLLLGLRVLARVRPEPELLRGSVEIGLSLLDR